LKNNKFTYYLFAVISLAIIFFACENKLFGEKNNVPPDTFLAIVPPSSADTLSEHSSQLALWWHGNDPDGIVEGYIYSFYNTEISWDDTSFDEAGLRGFTTAQTDTFPIPLGGKDSTFTFSIAAVDDWDAIDPSPAFVHIPIVNTPPEIALTDSLQDTTATTVTFSWTVDDPDGIEDITDIFYYINPTEEMMPDSTVDISDWQRLMRNETLLTLRLENGLIADADNSVWIVIRDRGNALSNIIQYPNPATGKIWFVKIPKNNVLFVDDEGTDIEGDSLHNVLTDPFFTDVFSNIGWQIDRYDAKQFGLPIAEVDFTELLEYYDLVIWFADNEPLIADAQNSLWIFLNNGGKVIFHGFEQAYLQQQQEIQYDFMHGFGVPNSVFPIDSVETNKERRIIRLANASNPIEAQDETFPNLSLDVKLSTNIIRALMPLFVDDESTIIYRSDWYLGSAPDWYSPPVVGVFGAVQTDNYFNIKNVILLSVPLLHMAQEDVEAFFESSAEVMEITP